MRFDPIARAKRSRTLRPELHQLETFLKVVETRSFTGAARLLGCSQSAVSQTIARLEEVFGGDLFVRNRGNGVALTPIGRSVEPYAIDLLATIDTQMRRAIETAQSRTGELGIGFYLGITAGPLRDGLRAFCAENPGVQLRMIEGLPGDLHRQLNDRAIDVMIASFMPRQTADAIDRLLLWEERLFVAVPAIHPLARRTSLGWTEIASLKLLMRTWQGENSVYRTVISRVGGRKLDCEQHAVSREAILAMVGLGMGAALVFESAVVAHPDLVFLPIRGREASATVEALWPAGDSNPIRHRLIGHLRRHGEIVTDLSYRVPAMGPGQARD
jgi:LysR family hydrogen peroxide-inducible transcriptional activator